MTKRERDAKPGRNRALKSFKRYKSCPVRILENAQCPHCKRIMPSIKREGINGKFYVGRCHCLGTVGDVKTSLREDGGAVDERTNE